MFNLTEYQIYKSSFILLFILCFLSYFILIPITIHILIISILILLIGCHKSLRLLDHNEIPLNEKETINENDAYKIPILASISLGTLYFIFKYFDKEFINILLSIYFCIVGIFTLTTTISPFLLSINITNKKIIFNKYGIILTQSELISSIIGIIITLSYFKTKHYILNNILGISFVIQALERVSIGSYRIGCIILVGLFFYDIFWVFGTEVMVTVAKSFDAPVKLLFPRILPTADSPGKFSLLGLGDIVVPGLFLALLLRYDAVKSKVNLTGIEFKDFPRPYFMTGLIFYVMGLAFTIVVMYISGSAQPALLYLVPACLGSTLILSYSQGDLTQLWAYDEAKFYEDARIELEKIAKEAMDSNGEVKTEGENVEDKKEK